jgi:hypothetical protein
MQSEDYYAALEDLGRKKAELEAFGGRQAKQIGRDPKSRKAQIMATLGIILTKFPCMTSAPRLPCQRVMSGCVLRLGSQSYASFAAPNSPAILSPAAAEEKSTKRNTNQWSTTDEDRHETTDACAQISTA